MPCPVAPEEQRGRAAVVEIGFYDLCDHIVLEDGPSERMRHDLAGISDAEKLAKQAGIVEEQLRTFNRPLVEVSIVGSKQEHNEACLQHGDPATRRVHGDAAVRGQARIVEKLRGSAGAKRQEAFKILQVPDVR